jgi:hypothetical protein
MGSDGMGRGGVERTRRAETGTETATEGTEGGRASDVSKSVMVVVVLRGVGE